LRIFRKRGSGFSEFLGNDRENVRSSDRSRVELVIGDELGSRVQVGVRVAVAPWYSSCRSSEGYRVRATRERPRHRRRTGTVPIRGMCRRVSKAAAAAIASARPEGTGTHLARPQRISSPGLYQPPREVHTATTLCPSVSLLSELPRQQPGAARRETSCWRPTFSNTWNRPNSSWRCARAARDSTDPLPFSWTGDTNVGRPLPRV
jgi:hypothetical protein